ARHSRTSRRRSPGARRLGSEGRGETNPLMEGRPVSVNPYWCVIYDDHGAGAMHAICENEPILSRSPAPIPSSVMSKPQFEIREIGQRVYAIDDRGRT